MLSGRAFRRQGGLQLSRSEAVSDHTDLAIVANQLPFELLIQGLKGDSRDLLRDWVDATKQLGSLVQVMGNPILGN